MILCGFRHKKQKKKRFLFCVGGIFFLEKHKKKKGRLKEYFRQEETVLGLVAYTLHMYIHMNLHGWLAGKKKINKYKKNKSLGPWGLSTIGGVFF